MFSKAETETAEQPMSRFLLREYIWDDLKVRLSERERQEIKAAAISINWNPAGVDLDLNKLNDNLRDKVIGLSVEIALIFKTRSVNARARRKATYGSPRGSVDSLTNESMFHKS